VNVPADEGGTPIAEIGFQTSLAGAIWQEWIFQKVWRRPGRRLMCKRDWASTSAACAVLSGSVKIALQCGMEKNRTQTQFAFRSRFVRTVGRARDPQRNSWRYARKRLKYQPLKRRDSCEKLGIANIGTAQKSSTNVHEGEPVLRVTTPVPFVDSV
jgi:hypothetical protein